MSKKLQSFIDLTRIKRPIGYMLLFWPCLWGLTIGYDFNKDINLFIFYSILFFSERAFRTPEIVDPPELRADTTFLTGD